MNFIGSVEWIQDRLWIGGDSGFDRTGSVKSDENWIDLVRSYRNCITIAASGDTVMLACQEKDCSVSIPEPESSLRSAFGSPA